jgi:hypothetical protein
MTSCQIVKVYQPLRFWFLPRKAPNVLRHHHPGSTRRLQLLGIALALACPAISSGCSALIPRSGSKDSVITAGEPLETSESYRQWQQLQGAGKNNQVIVEILEHDDSMQTLPLPETGQPVFLNDLIQQTGLSNKFSRMKIKIKRLAPGGERYDMFAKFDAASHKVEAGTDYQLHAGDHIVVADDSPGFMDMLLDSLRPGALRAKD